VAHERSPQTIKSNLWLLGLLHIIVEIFCAAEDALETNWWWQVSSFSSAGASRRNVRQHERRSEPFTYAKTALFGRQTFAVLLGFPLNQEFTWAALRAHACDPINDKLTKHIGKGLSNRSVALPEEAMMFRSVIEEIEQVRPDVQRERTHMNQARNSLPPHCT